MFILQMLSTLVCLTITLVCAFEQPTEPDTSNIIINFSPYVSILDTYNKSRYGVDDMLPLVSLVATRFKRVYIDLSDQQFLKGETNSLQLSPKAVAKYNCLDAKNSKVEVILQFSPGSNVCGCEKLEAFKRKIEWYVNTINDICEGTVKTIATTYPCEILFSCTQFQWRSSEQYQWVVQISYSSVVKVSKFLKESPQTIIVSYLDLGEYFKQKTEIELVSLEPLQSKYIWHTFNFPDQFYNLTGFISTWNKLFASKNHTFVVNSAFDEPLCLNPSWDKVGYGWWHLVDDPGTTDTKLFKFEEKLLVASKVDEEENPKNFDWLYNEIVFSNMSTGMVSSETTFDYLLDTFCKVLVIEDEVVSQIRNIKKTDLNTSCKPFLDIIFVGSPLSVVSYTKFYPNVRFTHLVTLRRWYGSYTLELNILPIKTLRQLGIYQYGYSFDLIMCDRSFELQKNKNFTDRLKDPKSKMYLFTYSESKEILINQGATRMFQRVKVLFKECQKMVFGIRNSSTKVAFALETYFWKAEFQRSPLHLQNYVKYISLLNNWVADQENTIIFLGQGVDTIKMYGVPSKRRPVVGWYFDSDSFLKTKWQDALEVSIENYRKPKVTTRNASENKILSASSITGIVLVSLTTLVLLIIITIYFTRRYYATNKFSREEIDKFLNGENSQDESNVANSTPYDKTKYEISNVNFTIEEELGSGECGKVCRGKITKGMDEITVAVKTSNPKTFHKTVIAGLLSEIKVLPYLGKHQNIVKLLGANTENLKNGKIYVFLELCQFGSLDKTLKEIGQLISSPVVEVESRDLVNQYTNLQLGTENILDFNLSDDLRKWSIEICNGMKYLAEKHVVHADLATRNVLLNLRKEAKICDFGLSRRMYNYTNYVKTQQEPLPWKWMAPETLNYMTFSEKSDVWAYGITLWEMYSLGKSPYPGLSWDVNFAGMLERGLRLSEPEFNERNMYSVMKKCWEIDVERRPKFMELYEILNGGQVETADMAESVV